MHNLISNSEKKSLGLLVSLLSMSPLVSEPLVSEIKKFELLEY